MTAVAAVILDCVFLYVRCCDLCVVNILTYIRNLAYILS